MKFPPSTNKYVKLRYLNPKEFDATLAEGYHVNAIGDQGKLKDPRTQQGCPWEY
ncbi:tocopherol cyclase family protein [Laspinema olomoucense]|uniref:Tocopherol cyclase family protein n=1 Tax=Laspinema olomoucense D3b TaxID=2953688 RepID=A0ABT2N8C9_9CYAN|nr:MULTISPECIES: tocopherol cyclase family protein [unclassified Laspinema]MCT7976062.1 tocopherol cyclase family protein [Laspinema sp. D3d]MCT7978952.1 tocopherol cyclase family protein [Laspinema sp. D3b]MCT7991880.1 tocopherol cyclase family protein [Laspinema sp. D3a]MCT7996051.1 tocopherol cyclase family protein [Laspinema sp. D3c]